MSNVGNFLLPLTSLRLIAIMLGHLEMTVEECIEAYTKLMKRVFEKKAKLFSFDFMGRLQGRFSTEALAEAITEVLRKKGRSPDEKFYCGNEPNCKV